MNPAQGPNLKHSDIFAINTHVWCQLKLFYCRSAGVVSAAHKPASSLPLKSESDF